MCVLPTLESHSPVYYKHDLVYQKVWEVGKEDRRKSLGSYDQDKRKHALREVGTTQTPSQLEVEAK